ncbi:hypothetical protein KEM52_000329, partial [Ascosphaera acerosa]
MLGRRLCGVTSSMPTPNGCIGGAFRHMTPAMRMRRMSNSCSTLTDAIHHPQLRSSAGLSKPAITLVGPTTLSARDQDDAHPAPSPDDLSDSRVVPAHLLRPTKPALLRFALTDALRDPSTGDTPTAAEQALENQLRAAFARPILDRDFANRDVSCSRQEVLERDVMKQVPMVAAIRSARTLTELQELLETRLAYVSHRTALTQAWAILEKRLYAFIDEAEKHAAAGHLSHDEADERKREALLLMHTAVARVDQGKGVRTHAAVLPGYHALMRLAATSFSPQALYCALDGAQQHERTLPLTIVVSVLRRLTTRLEVLTWHKRLVGREAALMAEVLTGHISAATRSRTATPGNQQKQGSHTPPAERPANLFDMVKWGRSSPAMVTLGYYARLLALLGDITSLRNVLPLLKQRIESHSPGTSIPAIKTAATIVQACEATGDRKLATECALLIARVKPLDDVLPKRTVTSLLLGEDGAELHNYVKTWKGQSFLAEQLLSIERRLGLHWNAATGTHSLHSSIPLWHEQQQADGNSSSGATGWTGWVTEAQRHQLLENIMHLGSSTSPQELAHLIDVIDDADGQAVALDRTFIPDADQARDYAWFPQSASLDLTTSPSSISSEPNLRTAASLGLLYVRPVLTGRLSHEDRARNLLQLGYIGSRAATAGGADTSATSYEPTGHLLAWDRGEHAFMLLFVGTLFGRVQAGPLGLPSPSCPIPNTGVRLDDAALLGHPAQTKRRQSTQSDRGTKTSRQEPRQWE